MRVGTDKWRPCDGVRRPHQSRPYAERLVKAHAVLTPDIRSHLLFGASPLHLAQRCSRPERDLVMTCGEIPALTR